MVDLRMQVIREQFAREVQEHALKVLVERAIDLGGSHSANRGWA